MIYINLGVDMGGTHTGIGLVDSDGNISNLKIIHYNRDTMNVNQLFEQINHYINENDKIDSIGIGVPGVASGTHINYTCNLPLSDIEVRDYIKTELPIYVSNDANCAAIAEYEIADKKKYRNYALITIGTGIGAGIILNGKLYEGSTGGSGEIGHIVIEKNGARCNCGRRGCFEQYASVSALKRFTNMNSLTEIFNKLEYDESIKKIFDTYIENLSEGLANFVNLFDVEMLVIGGGLSEHIDPYLPMLKEKILDKICNKHTVKLELKNATLKNDAGIIGAALLERYII